MARPKENIWNVPNLLTMLRILLIPVYIVLYTNNQFMWALAVFLIASFTDLLDGYIARKYNLITSFGKLMDPLADKIMVTSVLLSLTLSGVVPWAAVVIVIAKEALMVLGGVVMLKKGIVVQSQLIGKIAQFIFILALVLSFFHKEFSGWALPLDVAMIWLSVALTLAAFCFYGANAYKLVKKGTGVR